MTALLECDRPRFDGPDLFLGQFDARGPLLVLVGAWGPVFALVGGEQRLTGGSLRISGASAEGAAATGRVGLLRADAPFPPASTFGDVLCESACLLGHSKRRATELAREVASELGLSEFIGKKLSALGPGQRRAVGVAVASLGSPDALALEDPFGMLEPTDQAIVASVIERALEVRSVLLSVGELPGNPERDDFLARGSELLLLGPGGLMARGSHAELLGRATTYRVSLLRPAAPLLSRLTEAGYEARAVTHSDETALLVADPKGLGTEPMFALALEAGTPIVELWPFDLSGAHRTSEER